MYRLLRTLRAERKRILALETLGLTPSQAISVISASPAGTGAPRTTVLDGYFDASDRAEGGGVIVWWNDIEKDSRYEVLALLQNFEGDLRAFRC